MKNIHIISLLSIIYLHLIEFANFKHQRSGDIPCFLSGPAFLYVAPCDKIMDTPDLVHK